MVCCGGARFAGVAVVCGIVEWVVGIARLVLVVLWRTDVGAAEPDAVGGRVVDLRFVGWRGCGTFDVAGTWVRDAVVGRVNDGWDDNEG